MEVVNLFEIVAWFYVGVYTAKILQSMMEW